MSRGWADLSPGSETMKATLRSGQMPSPTIAYHGTLAASPTIVARAA